MSTNKKPAKIGNKIGGTKGFGETALSLQPKVRTAFAGLREAIEELPDGKQKTEIKTWFGEMAFVAGYSVFNLGGGVGAPA